MSKTRVKAPQSSLTESEALVLWLLLLLLVLRRLAVNCGDVSLLAAVVAVPAVAHPAAPHGCEDDLDAVQVGGEVGPWKAHTHLDEREQQQRQAGDELHPFLRQPRLWHTHSLGKGRFISVRGCVLMAGQWHAAAEWAMCHRPANEGENTIRYRAGLQALYLWEKVFWMCVCVKETKSAWVQAKVV